MMSPTIVQYHAGLRRRWSDHSADLHQSVVVLFVWKPVARGAAGCVVLVLSSSFVVLIKGVFRDGVPLGGFE